MDQAAQPWDQPPPKKGMGCGCKILVLLGILFGLFCVLCCGGTIWIGVHFGNSVSDDPVVIASVTEKMARISIPDELSPAISADLTIPVTNQKIAIVTAYRDASTDSLLLLVSLGELLSNEMQQQELLVQIDDMLSEQGLSPQVYVPDWEFSDLEVEIRGEPVIFGFAVGEDEISETQRIEVTGQFEGEDGPVHFWLRANAETYSEDVVVQMLESIE